MNIKSLMSAKELSFKTFKSLILSA